MTDRHRNYCTENTVRCFMECVWSMRQIKWKPRTIFKMLSLRFISASDNIKAKGLLKAGWKESPSTQCCRNTGKNAFTTCLLMIWLRKKIDDDADNHSATLPLPFLLGVIQELPERYRLVFNLYVLDGHTHKEIAELLGISDGTSKSNLARARQLLQQKINAFNKANDR